MAQIRQRQSDEVGRDDGAENVLMGHAHCITGTRHTPHPPPVAPLARATHVPDLVCIHARANWVEQLDTARAELRRYGETTPNLALPTGHDPVAYRWEVTDRTNAIYAALDTVTLRRLLAALLRDGAHVVCGIDIDGALHTAAADTIAVAA